MNGRNIAHMQQGLDLLGAKLAALPGAPRTVLELRVRWLLLIVVGVANVVGSIVVQVFSLIVIPEPPNTRGNPDLVNAIAFLVYAAVAAPVFLYWGMRMFEPVRRLVREGGAPDREQRHAVLLGPARLTIIQATLWFGGAVSLTLLNLYFGPLVALKMGLTCLLGGITTCAAVYLLAERLLRPAAALVLAARPPREHRMSRVTSRTMLAWALGTAVPVLGLIVVAIVGMVDENFTRAEVSQTTIVLGIIALVFGLQVTYTAARAIGDPIRTVREGMAKVAGGDLDAEVEVYDASELGQLQAGFNSMMTGLRAHERLQDLFGRHVGTEVAELALREDIHLGGEVREVAVLFVDLAGSTKLASERPPDEVVALLNAFFSVVVEVVNRNGGWINKFEGDAALAIFGAPVEMDDPGGHALAAARQMAAQLEADVPEVDAGIGVSAGPVVAGYIGAEQRFEYTVIGDPVNEAARLSDLAKSSSGRVLASGSVLAEADPLEGFRWETGQSVTLRGRATPTVLAAPRTPTEPVPPLPERVARVRGKLRDSEEKPKRRKLRLVALLTSLAEAQVAPKRDGRGPEL